MKERSQHAVSLALTALIVVTFAGSAWALHRLQQARPNANLEDVLYIPSAKTLKRMSLGYDGLLADIYWTRAVQYFGDKHRRRALGYPLLYPLLDITTELDPHLIVAYRFGATFLAQQPPDGAGQPERAVQLIETGIRNNPDNWRLYFDLGFVYSMNLQDYQAAANAFLRGSELPHTHPFLRIMAAQMAQHGGELQTARMLWQATYNSTDDVAIKANAKLHLQALDVDETVPKLEELVKDYRDKTGTQPTSFFPLVQAGLLPRVPTDPLGMPYKLFPDGHVEVQDPQAWSFIRQGLPPDTGTRLPAKP